MANETILGTDARFGPRPNIEPGSRYARAVLLAADVGNTQTVFGLYEGDTLREQWRIATESHRTGDETRRARAQLSRPGLADRRLSLLHRSAAGAFVRRLRRAGRRADPRRGTGVRTGIPIRYDDPREVGPDRIVNAVAANDRYGAPCIVVDFGTSTNFDVVSPAGEYVGGVLAPGVEISMDALFARAARLFGIEFAEPPTVIGKTTATALQSGLVYGFAGQVDGIVERIRAELEAEAPVVATGGLAELIAPHSKTIERVDADLTLAGLSLVWQLNAAPA